MSFTQRDLKLIGDSKMDTEHHEENQKKKKSTYRSNFFFNSISQFMLPTISNN